MSYDTHEYTHNFGIGVDIPMGSASLALTAGYHWPDCTDVCDSHFMASAGVSENLVSTGLGRGDGRGTFNIGIRAEAGFAAPKDTTLVSGKVAIPFSIVPGKRDLRFVPYIAPGVGVGLVRSDSTEAGILFTLGAGVGLITSRGFTASVGIERAFLSDGNWVVGVDIALGRRH
jgi:hypothetical protein